MYRQYENAYELKKQLEEKQACYDKMEKSTNDIELLYDLHMEIMELKDRINYAYQDEEFEENYN